MQLPRVFEKYRSDIDAELRSVVDGRQSPLYDMLRYHLGWTDDNGKPTAGPGGKALRPTLCLLAAEAAGGNHHQALPAAAALELVHNYSLIHDDVQDDDEERRHRPTVWSIWGKPQAINAGSAMRILASAALSGLERRGVPPLKRLLIHQLIDETTLKLLEGQYLDISFETRFDVTVDDYIKMIEGKTAALLASSLEAGARLATDDERVVEDFRSLGRNLGLAFQMRDDMLGIWGDEAATGKPSGNDIRRRKKTLPVVYALQNAPGKLKKDMVRVYSNGMLGDEAVNAIMSALDAVNARSFAQQLTETYCRESSRVLDGLAVPPRAKHELREVLDFLVDRSF